MTVKIINAHLQIMRCWHEARKDDETGRRRQRETERKGQGRAGAMSEQKGFQRNRKRRFQEVKNHS